MKKNSNGIIWGILLIFIGIGIGGRILDLFSFDLFFKGWWTLFIIIPSAVRFFTERGKRARALNGLAIGILLLFAEQGFIEFGMCFPLCIAIILIRKGLHMMFSGDQKSSNQKRNSYEYGNGNQKRDNSRKKKRDKIEDAANFYFEDEYDYNEEASGEQEPSQERYRYSYQSTSQTSRRSGRCACTAVLTGKEIRYHHEVFEGAMLSTILGAIDLDLSEAILYQDVVVEARVLLGGFEITVPKNARIVVNATPVFGAVENHVKRNQSLPDNAVTIYLNATCILGGIDIK